MSAPPPIQLRRAAADELPVDELPELPDDELPELPEAEPERPRGLLPSLNAGRTDEEIQEIPYGEARRELPDRDLARWLLLAEAGVPMAKYVSVRTIGRESLEVLSKLSIEGLQDKTTSNDSNDSNAWNKKAVEEERQVRAWMKKYGIQTTPDEP